MSLPVVAIENLSKRYGKGVLALDQLSLEVKEGEVFAFLGPNGSGKTTTLNILAQLLDPDSGQATLFGKQRNDPSYFENVAFMSGDSEFYWGFSTERTLRFYAQLQRAEWSTVITLCDEFGATPYLKRSWMELSNGEKTRVRLVQALMSNPTLLFLDEPTVGLDPDIAAFVRDKLKQLNNEGMTLFLTSHYMKDIDTLADTVAFIHRGKLLEVAPRTSFGTVEELEARFISHARDELLTEIQ